MVIHDMGFLPGSHNTHPVMFVPSVYLPASHITQLEKSEYADCIPVRSLPAYPALHRHEIVSSTIVLHLEFTGHTLHSEIRVDPRCMEFFPTAHCVQAWLPGSGLYFPRWHCTHNRSVSENSVPCTQIGYEAVCVCVCVCGVVENKEMNIEKEE